MTRPARETQAAPVTGAARNTNLDLIRGVAVLGILVMNAVSFGLAEGAYNNLSHAGMATPLDWITGVLGEIFVDQKFMGIFSALFGAGIVLFADRAAAKNKRPVLLSLWRNFLLFAIGLLHTVLWAGDILVIYALAAPFLIAMRRAKPTTLFVLGTAVVLLSPISAWYTQTIIGADAAALGSYWGSGAMSEAVETHLLVDIFSRAIGMMLIGVGLYRIGFMTGELAQRTYARIARWGLAIGIPLASLGVIAVTVNEFDAGVALQGSIPNSLATIPMVLAYIAILSLWNARSESGLVTRLRAAGRMALTNYLTQTVIGVFVFSVLLGDITVTRTAVAVFVIAVWALQLAWSEPWLDRFRYGPAEWAWRCATYWTVFPLRRSAPSKTRGHP